MGKAIFNDLGDRSGKVTSGWQWSGDWTEVVSLLAQVDTHREGRLEELGCRKTCLRSV